jgi:hypothetical protein
MGMFCVIGKVPMMDPKEDLARFGYKLNKYECKFFIKNKIFLYIFFVTYLNYIYI